MRLTCQSNFSVRILVLNQLEDAISFICHHFLCRTIISYIFIFFLFLQFKIDLNHLLLIRSNDIAHAQNVHTQCRTGACILTIFLVSPHTNNFLDRFSDFISNFFFLLLSSQWLAIRPIFIRNSLFICFTWNLMMAHFSIMNSHIVLIALMWPSSSSLPYLVS